MEDLGSKLGSKMEDLGSKLGLEMGVWDPNWDWKWGFETKHGGGSEGLGSHPLVRADLA